MAIGLTEIAIVILLAAAFGIIAKLFGQPTILAYLLAGAVIGFLELFHIGNLELFRLFADIGIMFLLFLVGLEMNYASVKLVGKTSLFVGVGQILFTTLVGWGIVLLLGFPMVQAIYISVALAFSSTIVIIQLLSNKKALNSLYGKISVGFLLVQDFVAILILVVLAGLEGGSSFEVVELVFTVGKGIALFAIMFYLGRKLFPYIFRKIAHSQELLFLSSLAWLFAFGAAVEVIGFSIEIGGFLAGIALANSSEHYEISSRVRPLRDFFMLMFFALLGSSMVLEISEVLALAVPILIMSVFVLVGNPIIVMAIMGFMGYKKRTSFFSGVAVSQISEFSLLVASMGLAVGHITETTVAVITSVAVITIAISSYTISKSEQLFKALSPVLDIFEKGDTRKFYDTDTKSKPFIIIGYHRTGQSIGSDLDKDDLLVMDFDPEVIKRLKESGYNCIFGDINDFEIFEKVAFHEAELIISTSPLLRDNMTLIREVRRVADAVNVKDAPNSPKIVVRASNEDDARTLYEAGADYVLIPQFISGHYLSRVINRGEDLSILEKLKERDLRVMARDRIQNT